MNYFDGLRPPLDPSASPIMMQPLWAGYSSKRGLAGIDAADNHEFEKEQKKRRTEPEPPLDRNVAHADAQREAFYQGANGGIVRLPTVISPDVAMCDSTREKQVDSFLDDIAKSMWMDKQLYTWLIMGQTDPITMQRVQEALDKAEQAMSPSSTALFNHLTGLSFVYLSQSLPHIVMTLPNLSMEHRRLLLRPSHDTFIFAIKLVLIQSLARYEQRIIELLSP